MTRATNQLSPIDLVAQCDGLPAVTCAYFKRALGCVSRPVVKMRMSQCGTLRSHPQSGRWMRFQAVHQVTPASRRFCWDARIRVAPLVHLRVRDAYADGIGSGRVQLQSLLTLVADRNHPQLNAAALHRYLAEAVWYPSALLPSAGVQWSAIDERRAVASLSDDGTRVALEFRFNDAGEVESVYTPGRWQQVGRSYRLSPWEGRFSDYRQHQGLWVPFKGEVGWHADGGLDIVWRGVITQLDYAFTEAAP